MRIQNNSTKLYLTIIINFKCNDIRICFPYFLFNYFLFPIQNYKIFFKIHLNYVTNNSHYFSLFLHLYINN